MIYISAESSYTSCVRACVCVRVCVRVSVRACLRACVCLSNTAKTTHADKPVLTSIFKCDIKVELNFFCWCEHMSFVYLMEILPRIAHRMYCSSQADNIYSKM